MTPTKIIVHCAATPNGKKFTIAQIDDWHRERGFRRTKPGRAREWLTSVGYHFVIRLSGEVERGRDEDEVGAHTAGENVGSLGICLIGTDRFTPAQWAALGALIDDLKKRHAITSVLGHRDYNSAKECPCFDVAMWEASRSIPAENLLADESL